VPDIEAIGIRQMRDEATRVGQELGAGKWFVLKRHDVALGALLPWDAVEECLGKQAAADLVRALRGPRPEPSGGQV
jgi:hypothetical protein